MAALIDAIDIKRKTYFEFENAPYYCMDVEVSTPTARVGQTLVRLKMRNLLTRAVFDKTFKAGEKFKEPDLETVEASYLYSDADGSYFMDQTTFETLMLSKEKLGDALDRWELSLFADEPFRSGQVHDALNALLGGGDGGWAASMRAAVLLEEKTKERVALLADLRAERAGSTARDAVRRALVETLLHGDRRQLVATLDETLLGLRPRPASALAA